MLNKIPPLPNGLLPKLVYYPSVQYDSPSSYSGSSSANQQGANVVIMAETDEIVLFAYWDQVSPHINRYETHLKVMPSDYYED